MPLEIDGSIHAVAQRKRKNGQLPNAIVFHTGEGTASGDISVLTTTTGASSHYYVRRSGKILQFVDDLRRASHAGPTHYLNEKDWNEFSIGIETEHRDGQSWPQAQLDAIAALMKHLIQKHGIIRERIAAHRWVRKPSSPEHQDPTNFPDPRLRGFITRFYPEAGRGTLMRVNTNDASVRSTASTSIPTSIKLNKGDVIEIEREVVGDPVHGNTRWMKRVKGQGFIHSSLLDDVAIDMG